MRRFFHLTSLVLAAAVVATASSAAWALSLSDKANLQAAMQRHIDQRSVNGAYLHLDPKTGEVEALHPVTAHPMILRMGKNYVLCFDFKDEAGKKVDVDFYMARKAGTYVVFHQAVNGHDLLGRLMNAGKVTF